jgi:NAD(P)-dependent dehydrogenase (short-subunit alcohol dehydrogenase family)
MELRDKVVVVTGGGNGIGKALVTRFVAEGARAVVAVDINEEAARQTARDAGCVSMTADVGREEDIRRLIEKTEADIGPIDLFCSNAGVALGTDENSPNSEWQASWDVNVMSHVYASRHLLPQMLERRAGYFLITASAAGLLNQIGGAAYGTTKHAAVGFAEWLALTYAHEGIKVSVLCPQAVRTAMVTTDPEDDSARAAAADGMIEPEVVAEIVVEKLREEPFLILPHREVLEYMRRKTADYDRWIAGMNRLFRKLSGID